MVQQYNLVGEHHGCLTVERQIPKPNGYKSNARYWRCRCDCGVTVVCSTSMLLHNKHTRCNVKGHYERLREKQARDNLVESPMDFWRRHDSHDCAYSTLKMNDSSDTHIGTNAKSNAIIDALDTPVKHLSESYEEPDDGISVVLSDGLKKALKPMITGIVREVLSNILLDMAAKMDGES